MSNPGARNLGRDFCRSMVLLALVLSAYGCSDYDDPSDIPLLQVRSVSDSSISLPAPSAIKNRRDDQIVQPLFLRREVWVQQVDDPDNCVLFNRNVSPINADDQEEMSASVEATNMIRSGLENDIFRFLARWVVTESEDETGLLIDARQFAFRKASQTTLAEIFRNKPSLDQSLIYIELLNNETGERMPLSAGADYEISHSSTGIESPCDAAMLVTPIADATFIDPDGDGFDTLLELNSGLMFKDAMNSSVPSRSDSGNGVIDLIVLRVESSSTLMFASRLEENWTSTGPLTLSLNPLPPSGVELRVAADSTRLYIEFEIPRRLLEGENSVSASVSFDNGSDICKINQESRPLTIDDARFSGRAEVNSIAGLFNFIEDNGEEHDDALVFRCEAAVAVDGVRKVKLIFDPMPSDTTPSNSEATVWLLVATPTDTLSTQTGSGGQ